MADNRYIVTHSNYTIKKKHKILSGSTIYERDYMTTTNLGGFDSGSIPYGEGNFKIVINDEKNLKRKHKYGNWLKNENCVDESGNTCDIFSLNNISEANEEITSETKIEIKPNKNSFYDFVYYGSCEELIRATIDNIMLKFPAELYVSNEPYKYVDELGEPAFLGGENMVEIDNPFMIDLTTQSVPMSEKNKVDYNPIRYFSESATKYRIINKNDIEYCVESWDASIRNKNCFKDGDITCVVTLNQGLKSELVIKCYYKDKQYVLMTDKKNSGIRVRPSEGAITNFFNKLDDFGKFILNRDTSPSYSIEVDTPRETDDGTTLYREKYSWPTDNGYNLDISSGAFRRYYDSLIELGEWYDLNRVNNLWRRMTHQSIKDMDRTHTDEARNEDNSDYRIGTTRMHDVLNVYGRFFDDIKRYIDNIKTVNTITYGENNNTPDYFLSDTLQLSGWEVKSAIETLRSDAVTNKIYSGTNKKYDINDTNLQFFRNLKLNSKALFSRKGTIEGVEMLLSLFGLCSYDWARKQYNALPNTSKKRIGRRVLNWDDLDEETKMAFYDYSLNEYVTTIKNTPEDVVDEGVSLPVEVFNPYRKNFGAPDDEDYFHGLPIRMVRVSVLNDSGETVVKKYIIPWFDKKETMDGDMYFQMYGGWEKKLDMDVTPNKELYPDTSIIKSTSGFTIYGETKKYLKIANTIGDLKELETVDVSDGDVFYVNDISDFNTYYSGLPIENATNYFHIENADKYNVFGEEGWMNISKAELGSENPSDVATKVIYLESIIETNTGNNQHVGYGNYDGGNTYLDFFRQIFKGAIDGDGFEDGAYDCKTGELLSAITNCGFDVQEPVVDNMKTWYFTDTTKQTIYQLKEVTEEVYDKNDPEMNIYKIPVGYSEIETRDNVNIGKKAYTNREIGFKSEFVPFNLETQEEDSNDEAAANSIINIKKLVLKFNDKYAVEKGFREYLYTVILPYVEQMIPSTAIFEVILKNEDVDFTCFNFSEIAGVSK